MTFDEWKMLPIHSPVRKLEACMFLQNRNNLDQLELEEIESELYGIDFTKLVVHYHSVLAGNEYKGLLADTISCRKYLSDFYRMMNFTKQKSIEEIICCCEKCINTDEFCNEYYRMQLHLRSNKINLTNRSDLCKKLLVIEKEAIQFTSRSLNEVSLDRLQAFGIYAKTGQNTQINSMLNFLTGANPAKPIVEDVSMSDMEKFRLLVSARVFVGEIDQFTMINECLVDPKIAEYFGGSNVSRALDWISEYFMSVDDMDLLVSYLDYTTRNALNLAASGCSIDSAMAGVHDCVNAAKEIGIYVSECRRAEEIIEERCKMICNV